MEAGATTSKEGRRVQKTLEWIKKIGKGTKKTADAARRLQELAKKQDEKIASKITGTDP